MGQGAITRGSCWNRMTSRIGRAVSFQSHWKGSQQEKTELSLSVHDGTSAVHRGTWRDLDLDLRKTKYGGETDGRAPTLWDSLQGRMEV